MTKLDLYWMTNSDWYESEGFKFKIKDDAPQEAKQSWANYLRQLEEHKDAI